MTAILTLTSRKPVFSFFLFFFSFFFLFVCARFINNPFVQYRRNVLHDIRWFVPDLEPFCFSFTRRVLICNAIALHFVMDVFLCGIYVFHIPLSLRPRLYGENKVVPARRVTRLPELPWASQAGSPFFEGRVTLLAGSTFLHINTLARPAGSTPSRRDNQSMHERCWLWQRGQLFSHINAR